MSSGPLHSTFKKKPLKRFHNLVVRPDDVDVCQIGGGTSGANGSAESVVIFASGERLITDRQSAEALLEHLASVTPES